MWAASPLGQVFPHLRVGTFIEASARATLRDSATDFPTFGWGLSLRRGNVRRHIKRNYVFPHLRVGTFIEASKTCHARASLHVFPHLRVGTFIEASALGMPSATCSYFPTFGWGLSLRPGGGGVLLLVVRFPHLRVGTFIEAETRFAPGQSASAISPPSGGDFH